MITRFICPHCHCPVDPQMMELARGDQVEYRICPACDEGIPLARSHAPTGRGFHRPDAAPAPAGRPATTRAVP
ncbi:MAG: hypothetical protein HY778_04385 [Betaproteobacteria bacterium]|nr:hypothetical protein [Betaproteobacteria bacterium]